MVSWGAGGNGLLDNGLLDVPPLPAGLTYVEIAAGSTHMLARRSDGSVVAWGSNEDGQLDVPELQAGQAYVEVAAGGWHYVYGEFLFDYGHSVARRNDGSVVAWGLNGYGQTDVPALPAGLEYVEVAAGGFHTVARRSDGSVVAWGANYYGQLDVPPLPAGLAYVQIAAGLFHTIARRSDGSVVAWGDNTHGQLDVPVLPEGVGYVEVAAGENHAAARRSDGMVIAWGDNSSGQLDVPGLPAGLAYVELAAGGAHTLARTAAAVWVSLGSGLPGLAGVPVLTATGTLEAGTAVSFLLTHAHADSISALIVGSGVLDAQFKGGIMVPLPHAIFPLSTDGLGMSAIVGHWPTGVQSGLKMYVQWWVHDPTGPKGFAASHAVSGSAP